MYLLSGGGWSPAEILLEEIPLEGRTLLPVELERAHTMGAAGQSWQQVLLAELGAEQVVKRLWDSHAWVGTIPLVRGGAPERLHVWAAPGSGPNC